MRIGFSSCLRHILGCSSRKKVHPFNDDLDKKTLVRDPQLDVKPPTELVVLVLGSASAGKSTLCEVMRGNKSPQPKRTMGIKPVLVPHDESANIKFVDIGGSDQMEKIWYHQFHSSHAIIFVIDSSALEDEFQKAVTISKRNLGHRLLREKPVLVVCNKIDGPQNRKPQLVSIEMDLNHVGENKTKFIPVCIHPSSAGYNGEPDPLIASSIKWLVTTIFDNLHSINEQISQDSKVVEEERENLRVSGNHALLSFAALLSLIARRTLLLLSIGKKRAPTAIVRNKQSLWSRRGNI